MKKYFLMVGLYSLQIISSGFLEFYGSTKNCKYILDSFQEDVSLYTDIIQNSCSIETLDPESLSNFLYTAERVCDTDKIQMLYLQNFLEPILNRCVAYNDFFFNPRALIDDETAYWDYHIIRTVSDTLSCVRQLLSGQLKACLLSKYLRKKSERDKTAFSTYVGYDEDDLVCEIDYGQKINQHYERIKKNRVKSFLQEHNDLIFKKENVSTEGHLIISDEPWAELYCGGSFCEHIYYFQGNILVTRSTNEGQQFPTVRYYKLSEHDDSQQQEIKKEFFGNQKYRRFLFEKYQVENSKKISGRLFAELRYQKKHVFSCEYDDITCRAVISPDGSQVAIINLEEQIIKVYNLVQKTSPIQGLTFDEYKKQIEDSSLLQLYDRYKMLVLRK